MQPHWRERSEAATWIETDPRRRTLLHPLDDISHRNREDPRPLLGKLRRNTSACQVIYDRGSAEMPFDRATVEGLLDGDGFFWLDLSRPTQEDFNILREVFKFHPLAVEDSEQFDQRAKIDVYDDFAFIVVYGAQPDNHQLVEVHCFYSERFLLSTAKLAQRSPRSGNAISSVRRRSSSHRCCSIASSMASSTASSQASPPSTTGSTNSRTESS